MIKNKRTSYIALFILNIAVFFYIPGRTLSQVTNSTHPSAKFDTIIDLNGVWEFRPDGMSKRTIDVPGFYVWERRPSEDYYYDGPINRPGQFVDGVPEASYTRNLSISESMEGKRIFLRFEAVNFLSEVYVNNELVGTHIGGYVPFEMEITSFVNVPSTNTLRVKILYWDSRFIDFLDRPFWPVGFYGNYWNLGITGDVSLIARLPVFIEDVFVKTSVHNSLITAQLTITNVDTQEHIVDVASVIQDDGFQIKTLGSQSISVPANSKNSVTFELQWTDPTLWWPSQPHLYHLVTQLYENELEIDDHITTFGFREISINQNQFLLNGIRLNLRGDNSILYSENFYWRYLTPDPENWSAILDTMLSLHINVIRLHQQPVPPWMLDLCDAKGMLVIAESAIFSRPNVPKHSTKFLNNCIEWIQAWIKLDRNHPSIIIWCAENEMIAWGNRYTEDEIALFGQTIDEYDGSRPVLYEGENDLSGRADIYSYHYLWGYPSGWPSGSIYTMQDYLNPYKPTSFGEFEWRSSYVEENIRIRRQCVKVRAARCVDFADVRPYRLDWAWHPVPEYFEIYNGWTPEQEDITFLSNSLNPVAVFDKSYYEYDVFPSRPKYLEGEEASRKLILFNDESSNENVEIRWTVLLDGQIHDSGSFTESIPLGYHKEKYILFQVPYVSEDETFILQLTSWKNGQEKYRESLEFVSQDIGISLPQTITDMQITRSQSQVTLSWSPVKYNSDGDPISINHYTLYRSTDVTFIPEKTESFDSISDTSFVDDLTGLIGNTDINVFYSVTATSSNGTDSRLSNIVGEFDFNLKTTPTSSVNDISIPLILSGITQANDLKAIIPGCEAIGRWNASGQGYEQYIPGIESTNFTVSMGLPYYVHASKETTFTVTGPITQSSFNLITTATTSFNHIMLPLEKPHLTQASSLMADIQYCNGVALWNTDLQGFEQYIPGIPETDFGIRVGYPYYVNVTQNRAWPSGKAPVKALERGYQLTSEVGTAAPHAVWGRLALALHMGMKSKIHFSASITSRPGEILNEDSPGCMLTDSYWIVQCSSFPSHRKVGDSFEVVFYEGNGTLLGKTEITLTRHPDDRAEDLLLCSDNQLPTNFNLSQNYPNPFNMQTTIVFQLPYRSPVSIRIYNMNGKEICTLLQKEMDTGFHKIQWNARDNRNRTLDSGIYIIRLETEDFIQSKKMVLIR
jgi:hypothetical protein